MMTDPTFVHGQLQPKAVGHELRCESGHLWGMVNPNGLLEIQCRYCARAVKDATGEDVIVLHYFDPQRSMLVTTQMFLSARSLERAYQAYLRQRQDGPAEARQTAGGPGYDAQAPATTRDRTREPAPGPRARDMGYRASTIGAARALGADPKAIQEG